MAFARYVSEVVSEKYEFLDKWLNSVIHKYAHRSREGHQNSPLIAQRFIPPMAKKDGPHWFSGNTPREPIDHSASLEHRPMEGPVVIKPAFYRSQTVRSHSHAMPELFGVQAGAVNFSRELLAPCPKFLISIVDFWRFPTRGDW
jgi:hypothetical protein